MATSRNMWEPDKVKYTGLFISPSGISEIDCATGKENKPYPCLELYPYDQTHNQSLYEGILTRNCCGISRTGTRFYDRRVIVWLYVCSEDRMHSPCCNAMYTYFPRPDRWLLCPVDVCLMQFVCLCGPVISHLIKQTSGPLECSLQHPADGYRKLVCFQSSCFFACSLSEP